LVFQKEISGAHSAAGQRSYLERRVVTAIDLAESDPARTDRVYPAGSALFDGGVDLVTLTAGADRSVLYTTHTKTDESYPVDSHDRQNLMRIKRKQHKD